MASRTGYYILVKPKKLYHVYNMNKCIEYGDNLNLYNFQCLYAIRRMHILKKL